MIGYVIVKCVHILAILTLFSCWAIESVLVKERMTPEEVRRFLKVDLVYGIAAAVVFMLGLTLWLLVGKPADFYTPNPVFQIKVGLFLFVGLFAIYPTLFFIKHRHATTGSITVPVRVIRSLRGQILILMVLPLLAVLMAQGIGLKAPA